MADGGKVIGKSHSEGGEKFQVSGKVLELEGDEGVINKRSMRSDKTYKVTGTPAKIASCINELEGGVKFEEGKCDIQKTMTKEEAIKEAKRISKKEGVVQHVNTSGNGIYTVDDWYDTDETVASYENGKPFDWMKDGGRVNTQDVLDQVNIFIKEEISNRYPDSLDRTAEIKVGKGKVSIVGDKYDSYNWSIATSDMPDSFSKIISVVPNYGSKSQTLIAFYAGVISPEKVRDKFEDVMLSDIRYGNKNFFHNMGRHGAYTAIIEPTGIDLDEDKYYNYRDLDYLKGMKDGGKTDQAEKYFEDKRIKIKNAKSINEIIDILSDDINPKYRNNYKRDIRGGFNKDFKGNLEKTRTAAIVKVNIYEHNFLTMKDGGLAPKTYGDRKPQGVWKAWSFDQRKHFFEDHFPGILGYEYLDSYRNSKYKDLPVTIKARIEHHVFKGRYKDGGLISKAYADRKPQEAWEAWNFDQRKHFVYDHLSSIAYKDYLNTPYKDLPEEMKEKIIEHLEMGRFKDGGTTSAKFKEVADFGNEVYYKKDWGEVAFNRNEYIELISIAHIRDLEDAISGEDLKELWDKNIQLEITLVPK